jgi:GNAT superfamily N-acetyltransferase
MNTHLREARPDDVSSISDLVQAGFVLHVAPDWERPAREGFMRDTTAEKLAEPIATATFAAVYQDEGRILGVISLPRPNLVQLFFVAPTHLRRGIGRTLWEAARAHIEEKHPEVKTIELNSSLYAVSTYKALGFYPICSCCTSCNVAAQRSAAYDTPPKSTVRPDGDADVSPRE